MEVAVVGLTNNVPVVRLSSNDEERIIPRQLGVAAVGLTLIMYLLSDRALMRGTNHPTVGVAVVG